MNEPSVIADERDLFKAALLRMRDAFEEACRTVDWATHNRLNSSFFDGYAEAKRLFGTALLKKEVLDD